MDLETHDSENNFKGSSFLVGINTKFFDEYLANLGPSATKVYLTLCVMNAENGEGVFAPTMGEIAGRSGISKRTTRQSIAKLVEVDLVRNGKRNGDSGEQVTNNYLLITPESDPRGFLLQGDPLVKVNEHGGGKFCMGGSVSEQNPAVTGVASDLLSKSTVRQENIESTVDLSRLSSGLSCNEKSEQGDQITPSGVARKQPTTEGSIPGIDDEPPEARKRRELMAARDKMPPNRRLVSLVWELYDEMGIKRPTPSVIGKWRKNYEGKFIIQVLNDLAGSGHLEKGLGYVFTVLKAKYADYKTSGNPLDDPHGPARDGIKWGGYRWSSILGTNVEKEFWVSMVGASEMDIKMMKANSIQRPEPQPWEAVGDFSDDE